MKTYIVAALHGDELFGLKVIAQIKNTNNYICKIGHPEAIAKHKRYIETDLNRSFDNDNKTIENRIANNIQKEITDFAPDLIIDIHTSKTPIGKIAIVAEYNPLIGYVAQAINLDAVVIMPKHLTKISLIGYLPNKSISIELGENYRSDKLAINLARIIESLDMSKLKSYTPNNMPIFKVTKQIDKDYKYLDTIKNMEFNTDLGGYPFLASPKSYKSFGGFLLEKIK